MNLVGKSEDEIRNRLDNVGSLISKYTKLESIETVLDWGGGEGKFIPRELRDKKVSILDVSNEKLAEPTFIRIEQPATNQKFDFIQVCHVLEHVSSPHEFLKNTLPYLNRGGYLYLEVPQDRTEEDIQQFIKSDSAAIHKIHEHLNLYSVQSIKALANSLELKELVVEKKEFNLGREKVTIVSGLFMKI
jgi:2-polyprenyl-3-methyl-5-hydroxy-6-metoxy-1,4-benzoquinol methylase